MQLKSSVSTHKVAALVGMSQYFVAHLRKDVGDEIERQRIWRPRLLTDQEKRHCVIHDIEGRLGTTYVTTTQL